VPIVAVPGPRDARGHWWRSARSRVEGKSYPRLVMDIGIASGRPPDVYRSEGAKTVYLALRGTRDAHVRDRDTRVRIALPVAQAAMLWQLLDNVLTADEKHAPPE